MQRRVTGARCRIMWAMELYRGIIFPEEAKSNILAVD
jgi:hypothetical protein